MLRTTTNHSNQEAAQSIYLLHEKKTSDQGLDVLVSLISLEQLCSAKKKPGDLDKVIIIFNIPTGFWLPPLL